MSGSLNYIILPNDTVLEIQKAKKNLSKTQEKIYLFWVEMVKKEPPEVVLFEFKKLFLHHVTTNNPEIVQALYDLLIADDEDEFINTFKRSCYILVNNWAARRCHQPIQELVLEVLVDSALETYTASMTLKRLRQWIINFSKSENYKQLTLFVARYESQEQAHWSEGFTSYLLLQQYTNLKNSPEHREAAKIRAQELKERFKFELAMYTARSPSPVYNQSKYLLKNPTRLGDNVLSLIKLILVKRGQFSYANLAHIFLQQTKDLDYKSFKQSLQKYLIYSVEQKKCAETINNKLTKKLKYLYEDYHDQQVTEALILRTCKRVVRFFTTENYRRPSSLFIMLLSQGHSLTLVIILLKITMICKSVRPYLEASLGVLIEYYMDYPEEECKWIINFLEILKITFVIYDDNVRFNLLGINQQDNSAQVLELDNYRLFSQTLFQPAAGVDNFETLNNLTALQNSTKINGSTEETGKISFDETTDERLDTSGISEFSSHRPQIRGRFNNEMFNPFGEFIK